MQITIGGPAGTGKGTVGRALAKHYGYKFVSGGDIFRTVAEEHGMTMELFDSYMRDNPEARIDTQIDDLQTSMGKQENNFVLESRLGWHFVPDSIKIKIDCELDERIRRIAGDSSGGSRMAYVQDSFEDTKRKTLKRAQDHQAKITEMYGIVDMVADEHFDFVVDSTSVTPQEVMQKIVNYITNNYGK